MKRARRSSSSVEEAIQTLRRNDPGRTPISGYKHGTDVVCTYYDHERSAWVFEHWENGRLVETKRSEAPDDPQHRFITIVRAIITNLAVMKAPYVSRDHVPRGGLRGVRVYDPAKRRARSILPV